MKTRHALALLLLSVSHPAFAAEPAPPKPAQSSAAYYQQGVLAMGKGEVEQARTAFQKAIELNPNNTNAQYQLKELNRNAAQIAGKATELKLTKVVVPVIQLDQATLQDSLGALANAVKRESKDDFAPNFVVQDPKNVLGSKQISLQLKSVPAKGVLGYILSQAGAKVRYEQHAIVVEPTA